MVAQKVAEHVFITSHLSVDFNISSQAIAKGVLLFVRLIKEYAFN